MRGIAYFTFYLWKNKKKKKLQTRNTTRGTTPLQKNRHIFTPSNNCHLQQVSIKLYSIVQISYFVLIRNLILIYSNHHKTKSNFFGIIFRLQFVYNTEKHSWGRTCFHHNPLLALQCNINYLSTYILYVLIFQRNRRQTTPIGDRPRKVVSRYFLGIAFVCLNQIK